ncbi:recombinase family protein [Pseudoclavibacter endophyticus]
MSAVSYIRDSRAQQAQRGGERDRFAGPARARRTRKQAHGLGALVSAEFIDRGQSGRSTSRPELHRTLAYLRENPVDYPRPASNIV